MDPVQPALLMEQHKIPPDGRLAGVQCIAQLLHRYRTLLCQQLENVVKSLLC